MGKWERDLVISCEVVISCCIVQYWQILPSFRTCYITGQWGDFRVKNATLCLHIFFCCFFSKNLFFIIFILFFDEGSNFSNRILTNQKPALIRNCQWNTESLKGFEMKPLWVFSNSSRDKNFRSFTSERNYRWFKLEETFLGFLIQSARQDLYGFSLRVNHLWFKLEKNPFLCTTVLHHWEI